MPSSTNAQDFPFARFEPIGGDPLELLKWVVGPLSTDFPAMYQKCERRPGVGAGSSPCPKATRNSPSFLDSTIQRIRRSLQSFRIQYLFLNRTIWQIACPIASNTELRWKGILKTLYQGIQVRMEPASRNVIARLRESLPKRNDPESSKNADSKKIARQNVTRRFHPGVRPWASP
jgi:hypothetical protein